MQFLIEALQITREFVLAGGAVLVTIAFVTWLMWVMLLERIWFLNVTFPRIMARAVARWNKRDDMNSWYARKIREATVARLSSQAQYSISIIRTTVFLCPMLGLLGTVSGVIEVFDAISLVGSNTRSMAAGVSKATIPTMAGMVSALSGLITVTLVARKADRDIERLALKLKIKNNETSVL